MARSDNTNTLVHLIRHRDGLAPLNTILQVIADGKLKASNSMIKGGYKCVCFSECPIQLIKENLISGQDRYSAYGFVTSKEHIFGLGGRPVIYQPDRDYEHLTEYMKWRHVRLDFEDRCDFTWEREWRVPHDIELVSEHFKVIVPNFAAREGLESEIARLISIRTQELALTGMDFPTAAYQAEIEIPEIRTFDD